ncbi:NitT/TauT family transport system substrate-binding protein [Marinitoga hydrogenitolerans DSM 16785]|uniref:NitT/TauT family transport system substrate-binding protein n=1 Tax=Marinitoga hydrogenitolerans (strain DSM 16785 / JCM 12826 / AT1271) TaxID=1122195 RepID=A0A1M4V8S6_MARH1|nr:ABC transporter substrate-binding protein [Marinitoga hydrogenitolerans]SHE65369.1 NitT/TauT family transport system substrate-binding protein [Marinitoga hydrogenitolerans DSM 16785]
MKKFLIFFILIIGLTIFSGTFYNPLGPTLLPAAGMYINKVPTLQTSYWRNIDQAQILVLKEQADFIVLPVALGVELINKGANYKLAGISLWKTFYLISSNEIKTIEDLNGKRIVTLHGPGQTADVILKILKKMKNIDFDIVYITSGPEIIQLLASGKETIAALPEPFVSLAEVKTKGKIKVQMDLQDLYADLFNLEDKRLPIAGVFVSNKKFKENPNFVKRVLNAYENSANNFYKNNFNDAVNYVFKIMQTMPKPVLQKAAERSEIYYTKEIQEITDLYLKNLFEYGAISKLPKDLYLNY